MLINLSKNMTLDLGKYYIKYPVARVYTGNLHITTLLVLICPHSLK